MKGSLSRVSGQHCLYFDEERSPVEGRRGGGKRCANRRKEEENEPLEELSGERESQQELNTANEWSKRAHQTQLARRRVLLELLDAIKGNAVVALHPPLDDVVDSPGMAVPDEERLMRLRLTRRMVLEALTGVGESAGRGYPSEKTGRTESVAGLEGWREHGGGVPEGVRGIGDV